MIRVSIKIGEGEIWDAFDKWGFKYLSSDNPVGAPLKSFDKTSYVEEAGEHIDTRTVMDAFDYKVTFAIDTTNSSAENANAKIAAFNQALYSTTAEEDDDEGSDICKFNTVEFYNYYKRVKIVGTPMPVTEISSFSRSGNGGAPDIAVFDFKIRISNPKLCDFSL